MSIGESAPSQKLTPGQALQKLRHYCAYQERCHSEVRDKAYGYGLNTREVDELTASLIQDDYLNEERFAIQFAGGRFRMKQWGRVKIRYELKIRRISDYCIKKALGQIGEQDYDTTFQKLVREKLQALRSEKNIFIKKRKLQDYLRYKGYENDLINDAVKGVGR
jgi:regulatory protein